MDCIDFDPNNQATIIVSRAILDIVADAQRWGKVAHRDLNMNGTRLQRICGRGVFVRAGRRHCGDDVLSRVWHCKIAVASASSSVPATALRWRLKCSGRNDTGAWGDFDFDTPDHYTATIISKGAMGRRECVNTGTSCETARICAYRWPPTVRRSAGRAEPDLPLPSGVGTVPDVAYWSRQDACGCVRFRK